MLWEEGKGSVPRTADGEGSGTAQEDIQTVSWEYHGCGGSSAELFL